MNSVRFGLVSNYIVTRSNICHNRILRKVLLETFRDAYCNIVELVKTQLGSMRRRSTFASLWGALGIDLPCPVFSKVFNTEK